jgi:hypothetical protein
MYKKNYAVLMIVGSIVLCGVGLSNGANAQALGSTKAQLLGDFREATAAAGPCSISINSKIEPETGNGYVYCLNTESRKQRVTYYAFVLHDELNATHDRIECELLASKTGTAAFVSFTNQTAKKSIEIVFSKECGKSNLPFISVGGNSVEAETAPVLIVDLRRNNVEVRSLVDPHGTIAELVTENRLSDVFLRLEELASKLALSTESIPDRKVGSDLFISNLKAQFKLVDEFFENERPFPPE